MTNDNTHVYTKIYQIIGNTCRWFTSIYTSYDLPEDVNSSSFVLNVSAFACVHALCCAFVCAYLHTHMHVSSVLSD
jgi:hypothetical protein